MRNLKTGVYRTTYGNAAVVDNDAAFDLDMAELIPMSAVTDEWIRDADGEDLGKLEDAIESQDDEMAAEGDDWQ